MRERVGGWGGDADGAVHDEARGAGEECTRAADVSPYPCPVTTAHHPARVSLLTPTTATTTDAGCGGRGRR